MNLISEDYLMHHGVKGMKWGVRHDPYKSARGSFHRGLSKVYSLNERTYRRLGNNTLASMNAAAKNQQLKKAEAADNAKKKDIKQKGTKQLQKNKAYRDKLAAKSEKKANYHSAQVQKYNKEYNDLKRNGLGSKAWKDEVTRRVESASKRGNSDMDKLFNAAASYGDLYSSRKMQYYMVDVKKNKEYHERVSKDWMSNNKKLMNMKITKNTSKKEIKKNYVGRRLNRVPDFD